MIQRLYFNQNKQIAGANTLIELTSSSCELFNIIPPFIKLQLKCIMNWRSNPNKRLIMDNGSNTIRVGTAASQKPIESWLNMVAIDKNTGNKLMGQQINQIWDQTKMLYYRPNVRGATMKFDHELTIWEEILKKIEGVQEKKSGFDLFDFSLTFPLLPCLPQAVLARYFEIFFEHFNFEAVLPYHSSSLIYEKAKKDYSNKVMPPGFELSNRFGLIVESSQSATYFTPFLDGQMKKQGIRKIDVGGKILTNWLKETLSFRHLDLKNSDLLIKQIKEDMCFVTNNFMDDMRAKKGRYSKHFILPDEQLMKRGYASDTWDPNSYTQKITLDKERFQIPQILFNPQDIGIDQCGIVQGVFESIQFSEPDVKHNFLQNIMITGGNTLFPNFRERLYREIRQNCPTWYKPRIYCMSQKNELFEAAVDFTKKSGFSQRVYLKNFYKQAGPGRIQIL